MAGEVTAADLARWAALAEAATPGPWRAEHRHSYLDATDDEHNDLGLEIVGPPEASGRGQFARGADASFIAASREAVPALVAIVRELASALDEANVEFGCSWCRGPLQEDQSLLHAPDCPIARARALLGATAAQSE